MAWSCQVCTFRHEEEQSLFVACFVCASPRGSDDNSASGDPPPPYSSATASAQPQARPAARPEIEAAEQTTRTHFRKVGSKTLLTSSGRVALDLSEVRYFTLPCSVALLPEAAELTLTSHRLIIVSGDKAIVGELSGISGANVEPQSFLSRARPRLSSRFLQGRG